MTSTTSLLELTDDESTGIMDPNLVADWSPVEAAGPSIREIPMDIAIWRAVAAVDEGLSRLARDAGIDLQSLCQAASEAFDPRHTPGDPINYTEEELRKVVDAELRSRG